MFWNRPSSKTVFCICIFHVQLIIYRAVYAIKLLFTFHRIMPTFQVRETETFHIQFAGTFILYFFQ